MIKIFQKLIALHVEASSTPISNLPYIICNEQRQQETLARLTPLPKNDKSTLHVGFSVWFNLDIICTTRPYHAAIFDIDPAVHHFIYPLLESLILNSATREEFITQFLIVINENDNIAPYSVFLEEQFKQLQSTCHGFLATQENFNYLKKMISEGRVFFGKADLTKTADISLIEQWISDNELDLKTLYLSNIREWINQQSNFIREAAQLNISKLIRPDVQLIDAFYPTTKKDGSGPPQRVTQGELPSYTVQKPARAINFNHQRDLNKLFTERSNTQSSESSEAQAATAQRGLSKLFAKQTKTQEIENPDTQTSIKRDFSALFAEQTQTPGAGAGAGDSETQISTAKQDSSDLLEKPAKTQRTERFGTQISTTKQNFSALFAEQGLEEAEAQISTAKRDFSALLATEPPQSQKTENKAKRKISTAFFFTLRQTTDLAQEALANSVSERTVTS